MFQVQHPAALAKCKLQIYKKPIAFTEEIHHMGTLIASLHIQYKPDCLWSSLKLSSVIFGCLKSSYVFYSTTFSSRGIRKDKNYFLDSCWLSLPSSFHIIYFSISAKEKHVHFHFLHIFF